MKTLSDSELAAQIAALSESLADAADLVAEIEGEIAHFGDSAPGTARVLETYRAAESKLRALLAERAARNPPAAVSGDETIPF
jgi:hypothetical protein